MAPDTNSNPISTQAPTLAPVGAAIGITGAFGSGCSTAAKHLRSVRAFRLIQLSDAIRKKWADDNPGRAPTRPDLQRLGDKMRAEGGPGALMLAALADVTPGETIVVDGIRNLGEVAALRNRYGFKFTLFAITAPAGDRWDRISQESYIDKGLSKADFVLDDERDRNEEISTGQQVELCVDASDVFVDNAADVNIAEFRKKVEDLADLVTGLQHRYPDQDEIAMNIAYGASHGSKCLKRHVGAVIADPHGQVIAVGYNENPLTTHPCVLEPEYDYRCYRDLVRNEHFAGLAARGAKCPNCGAAIQQIDGPPWKCAACQSAEPPRKTNLENLFFPDRAMSWCTAIHAEVWALMAAGAQARGGTLYTTTFPCFQCAEKIIHAGIDRVCFTEVYIDVKGELRLKLAKISLDRFEGVRSSGFHRIFDPINPR